MRFKDIPSSLFRATNVAAIIICFMIGSACADTQDTPTEADQQFTTKKVLLIGLDGIRTDILAQANTPNIDALIADGTYSDDALTRMPTVSGPGWSSMTNGVWVEKHKVEGNEFSANDYATYPDFLTRLEQIDPAFNTFAVLDWPPLGTTASGGPMISDAIDVKINIDGDSLGYDVADSLTAVRAAEYLAQEDPDAAVAYFGNTDVVGHDTNSLSDEYRASIETADRYVGQLIAALKQRPTYAEEDWLILMSTDHGRRDDGGHGGPSAEEKRILYLASGPSALKGTPAETPEIIDIAVTALTHLDVTIDPAWNLDGKVVGLETNEQAP